MVDMKQMFNFCPAKWLAAKKHLQQIVDSQP